MKEADNCTKFLEELSDAANEQFNVRYTVQQLSAALLRDGFTTKQLNLVPAEQNPLSDSVSVFWENFKLISSCFWTSPTTTGNVVVARKADLRKGRRRLCDASTRLVTLDRPRSRPPSPSEASSQARFRRRLSMPRTRPVRARHPQRHHPRDCLRSLSPRGHRGDARGEGMGNVLSSFAFVIHKKTETSFFFIEIC